ncbi:MAG: VPS10 domain-containing protein [Steroidobacteraceae bacterium]
MQSVLWAVVMVAYAGVVAAQVNPELFSGMKWRQIGPFRGGRVLAVSGVPGDPATWYFGAAAGGVWKSTNAGNTWQPIFDGQKIASIGAIAVADSDHNILYVGTGEACPRGDITYGDGVYKSLDAGKTWQHVGLTDTRHIGAIIVDPENPDIAFVAALGHVFGPNEERGIFRTGDGGKTWQRVLFRDRDTGGIDVVFDPHNPNTLFASLWQMRRQPWKFSSGGPGSGLYRSTDGGHGWRQIVGHGLPGGPLGRIGVSVSGADGKRVYAAIEAKEGGIFRSDDGGDSWTRINPDHRFRQRAWYYSHIFADPDAVDTVYVLNTGAFRSTDGGKSFQLLPAPHGDYHALWIDPRDPRRLINGNDGGATLSLDGGTTWTREDNQPTAQFYHVAVDNHWPYRVYGAQQDNSTIAIASRDDEGVIGRQDWYPVGGGESGYIAPDPRDPDIVYANADSGQMTRYDHRTGNLRDVSMYPLDVSGNAAESLQYRIQWTEPVFVSRHDSNVLYTAAQFVLKSTDQGRSWKRISGDLTRNDKSKQHPSGGPITLDITSVEYYDTVFALAESPLQKGLLWAGSDDGLIHVTRDDGRTWQNVTPTDMPEWSMVSIIEPSPHDAKAAYAAIDRHKLDDLKPLIYKTHDGGRTWTRIVAGIPDGAYVRSVREDPKRKGLLYAGTELGVYLSFDDGEHWQPLQLNLPVTPVHDLAVKDDDLVAATHGRSFWILDDLTPLRQIETAATLPDVRLYRPEPAYRLHFPTDVYRRRPVGDNPPNGAVIDYFLKVKPQPSEEITLEILDGAGKVLRRYSNHKTEKFEQPAEWPDRETPLELLPDAAGMNRFAWDLRVEDPVQIPGAFYADEGPRGPVVNPGSYMVRLTTRYGAQSVPLEVLLDPRLKGTVTAADIAAHWQLASRTNEDIEALHRAVNQMRASRAQLDKLRPTGTGPGTKALGAAADFDRKMAAIEEQLIQVNMKASEDNLRYPNRLNEQYDTFSVTVDGDDVRPTEPQEQVFSELHRRLTEQLANWKSLRDTALPLLNDQLQRAGASGVAVPSGD